MDEKDVRLVRVNAGGGASEREGITGLTVPGNVSREGWRSPDRCKQPIVEGL